MARRFLAVRAMELKKEERFRMRNPVTSIFNETFDFDSKTMRLPPEFATTQEPEEQPKKQEVCTARGLATTLNLFMCSVGIRIDGSEDLPGRGPLHEL
jgi:hypothetical protein